MQFLNLAVLLLVAIGMGVSLWVVWKVRDLKSQLIAEHSESIQRVLTAVGEIESLGEAELRASAIGALMDEYNLAGLVVPLRSGGKVGFRIDPAGLRVELA